MASNLLQELKGIRVPTPKRLHHERLEKDALGLAVGEVGAHLGLLAGVDGGGGTLSSLKDHGLLSGRCHADVEGNSASIYQLPMKMSAGQERDPGTSPGISFLGLSDACWVDSSPLNAIELWEKKKKIKDIKHIGNDNIFFSLVDTNNTPTTMETKVMTIMTMMTMSFSQKSLWLCMLKK